jgi:small ligand-binding sensory domain FIST
MKFASALSEHPVAATAVGEVIGEVLDRVGPGAQLACLFTTAPHTGALEDIASAVHELLQPEVLVGATANAVVGGQRGVEDEPGIALFAARIGGRLTPVRLTAEQTLDGWVIEGVDADAAHTARTMLLLPDPFTFPADPFLSELQRDQPHLRVIGGLASAARGPGGNRLVLNGTLVNHGAVGVLVDEMVVIDAVVSQGCRPIGQPFIVTKAERNALYELAGRPALDRLLDMVEGLPPEERALAARGLHCGIVVDEHKANFERGDFLIRGVLGADRETKAVVVGDEVAVGSTVQFQVRDASTAAEDLAGLLSGHQADAALLFTCNGRGRAMFGDPHHDATVVQEAIGPLPVAGMFCAGELGPVGGRNVVHGFTASVALFGHGGSESCPLA